MRPPPNRSAHGTSHMEGSHLLWPGDHPGRACTRPPRNERPKFNQLRKSDGSRIRYRKVAETDGAEVSSDEIVKGYEIDKDRYVVFSDDELQAALRSGTAGSVDVVQFVEERGDRPDLLPEVVLPGPREDRGQGLSDPGAGTPRKGHGGARPGGDAGPRVPGHPPHRRRGHRPRDHVLAGRDQRARVRGARHPESRSGTTR